MNHEQMRQRCPSSKYIKRAYLESYKFVYDGYSKSRKGAVANIIEEKGAVVWGGLFEIDQNDLASLDIYEGYPISYDRKTIKGKDENKNIYEAIGYFRKGKSIGTPADDYRNVVLQGARDCNLPDEYIKNNI